MILGGGENGFTGALLRHADNQIFQALHRLLCVKTGNFIGGDGIISL